MIYTVKQKIRLGTIFLFFLSLLSGGVGMFHILRLKNDAQDILKNNYESLDYGHTMQRALEKNDRILFDQTLRRQEQNFTEKGEQHATRNIRLYYKEYEKGSDSLNNLRSINENIQTILSLNMAAIELKNNKAGSTADLALAYISAIVAIILLVGFTFTFNFPSVITSPIQSITDGIIAISAKNYQHRIHLDRKDEFGRMAVAFNEMAERLEYFENSNLNKLIFEKARAEAVINSLKDASIGIDAHDTILFANEQAQKLLGLHSSQIVALPAASVSAKNELFQFLLQEKGGMPFKVVLENRENYFVKEIIDIGQDGFGGKVIFIKNITSFKEIDVAKTNFIATISHELKTPLASSDFSIRLLEDKRIGTLTDEQQSYVDSLKKDNQRMLKILSELLNMAQIETGKMQLNIALVSPSRIAESAIESVEGIAFEKKVVIKKNIADGLPEISVDAEKISWVLNNFLTNAIKYSPLHSEIILKVDSDGKEIIFSVSDGGTGIHTEYLNKVFDRYFKVPGSQTNGNGLGLAISKEFIEAHHGRIWVTSQFGSGSTFGFNIAF